MVPSLSLVTSRCHDDDAQQDDSLLQLLGDIASMHESLMSRRRALFERLAALAGADIWVWVSIHVPTDGLPVNSDAVDGGWIDEEERTQMYAAVNTPDCHALSTLLAAEARSQGKDLTVIAADFPQPADVREAHDRFLESANLCSRILAIRPRNKFTNGLLALNRRCGGSPFTEADRAIVDRLLAHVPWVHQSDSEMSRHAEPLLLLTPRERQILRLSMVGHPRKHIAGLLKVSTHTITDHFKSIYLKLNVRSQGELLSKFISGKLS